MQLKSEGEDPNPNQFGKRETRSKSKRRRGWERRKGKGNKKNLARRRENPSPAREKKTEPGLLLAGLGQGVTAARPLDGGALTRWGELTPVRGPAAVPWSPSLALSR